MTTKLSCEKLAQVISIKKVENGWCVEQRDTKKSARRRTRQIRLAIRRLWRGAQSIYIGGRAASTSYCINEFIINQQAGKPACIKTKNKNNMKKQTKIKIAAVAAGFALATLIGTFVLVAIKHPAQWYVAGVCIAAMGVTGFVGVTIED